jgi:hypothetical protein
MQHEYELHNLWYAQVTAKANELSALSVNEQSERKVHLAFKLNNTSIEDSKQKKEDLINKKTNVADKITSNSRF